MRDRVALALLDRTISAGRLRVILPDGDERILQGPDPGPEASVMLYVDGVLSGALIGGALGLLEAYMDRRFDTDDLAAFLHFAAVNQQAWIARRPMLYRLGRGATRLRRTRHTQVETMAGHYNLGNEFYAAWLDPTMTYSAGRFDGTDDLEQAQVTKYRSLAAMADIEPGHRVLEIGTGWGGFAIHLAGMGCQVTTLTIAEEQLAFVNRRLEDEELAGSVDARLLDFADIAALVEDEGSFDRVVSVEMIESIDESRWQELFDVIARALVPGGKLGMQAIVIHDDFWDSYRSNPDFIQRYIFPGGMLPTPAAIREMTTGAGLKWNHDFSFGLDYARTLSLWHDRFEAAWADIKPLGFDERFRRMWKAYLAYCEAGFRIGRIDVMQLAAIR